MRFKLNNKIKRLLKASAISVLAFALSWIMIYDFTSLSYFAPMEKASDFISTDFYMLVAQKNTVKKYDDKIAVVAVDGLSRHDISETFKAFRKGMPNVVAVDIMFEERGDDADMELVEALSKLSKVVYPQVIAYEDDRLTNCSIYDYLDNAIPGVVNLDVNSNRNIVRTFKPVFSDGDENMESISYAAVKGCSGQSIKDCQCKEEAIDIDFTSTEFDCYSADEIRNKPDLIKDKIVFVGELQNISDMHSTPIDEYMSGVLIHAYSASTILNGKYMIHVSSWLVWIISFLLSMTFIYAQLTVGDTKAGNMIIRWMQAGILLLLVFVGSILYVKERISFDLSLPLLMIALGLLACDLWQLFETVPSWGAWISKNYRLLNVKLTYIKYFLKKICVNKIK